MEKYCIDIMKQDASGRWRFESRTYFGEDEKEDLRFIKKHGVESAIKKWRWEKDFDGGEYLVTFFREIRKRNGAIKSKKKIDGYRFEV